MLSSPVIELELATQADLHRALAHLGELWELGELERRHPTAATIKPAERLSRLSARLAQAAHWLYADPFAALTWRITSLRP